MAEIYQILFRDSPGRYLYWDGEDWTTDERAAARYTEDNLPESICSVRYSWDLELDPGITHTRFEYAPPDDYWPEHELGYAQGDEYQEPSEWLADEYDDTLYIVQPVPEDEDKDEEESFSDLSSDDREQYLRSLETDVDVADAIAAIAQEDGCSFEYLWENGTTPKSDAETVEARIVAYIRETVPEDEIQEEYAWGEGRITV